MPKKSVINGKQELSRKKKERNNKRLRDYYETKNVLRELPFSNLRHNAFINALDVTSAVRTELAVQKTKCRKFQRECEIRLKDKSDELNKLSKEKEELLNTISEQKLKIKDAEAEKKQLLNLFSQARSLYDSNVETIEADMEKLNKVNCEIKKSRDELAQKLHNAEDEIHRLRSQRHFNNRSRGPRGRYR